jgi:hypothetical protein
MLRRPLILAFLTLAGFAVLNPAAAQTARFEVTGTVTDSLDAGLGGATVVVLHRADSTIVGFGITRDDGLFRIARVPSGEYLLQVTFVGYRPRSAHITVADAPLNTGRIRLYESVEALDEMIVTADRIPMIVRQDTLEYVAAAFRVPPNATVEDLLRRLPGIEVERDGTIRAQGEEVRQVLVDGREFFGNDPTVATRNLPAEAVDRVQVYDRRSDAAEFTGVDDGREERTINLALRPDRRHGYFGNASGGVGDISRFESQASVHRFNPTTQLSFIGNANNVNRQGFSMQEYASFMGGFQNLMGEGGMISTANMPISSGLASGFSTTLSGGLNASHKFGNATSLRASYLGYYLDHRQDRHQLQRELSGASAAALTDRDVVQRSSQLNHRVNLFAEHTFSEGHDLRLRSNFQMSGSDLENSTVRETRSGDDVLENASRTRYDTAADALNADGTLTYRRRFAPGRTLVAETRAGMNDGDLSAELTALNEFYREGNLLTSEEIDQLQAQLSNTITYSQRLTFTEPLGRRQLLQFELQHRGVLEEQDRSVFDMEDGTSRFNDVLSSAFDRAYRYYRGGVTFRRAVDPVTVSIGLNVQQAHLEGTIRNVDDDVNRRFVRLLPSAAFTYAFSQMRTMELRYNATTREPSMRDLQPFADNRDPLNIYIGNSELRPETTHNATARFMMFDRFTMTNLLAFVRAGYTHDRIARSRTIDEHFRQTVTPINTDGDWTVAGNLNFGTPIRPLGIRLNASTQNVFNRGAEFINDQENASTILRSTWDLRVDNREKEVLDAMAGARLTFNDVRYSLNSRLNRSYINRTFYGEIGYRLAEGWRVTTGLDYNVYAGGVVGEGSRVPLLRAEISRMVMNNRAEIRLEGRDLLNQSVGVNYSNTSTYIQEERIESLGRYVMLKFVYNLGGSGARPGGGVMVMGGT